MKSLLPTSKFRSGPRGERSECKGNTSCAEVAAKYSADLPRVSQKLTSVEKDAKMKRWIFRWAKSIQMQPRSIQKETKVQPNGARMGPTGGQKGAKGRPKCVPKQDLGKLWEQYRFSELWLLRNGSFWDHFSSTTNNKCDRTIFQKSIPKKLRKGCQHGSKMLINASKTDATSMHLLERRFAQNMILDLIFNGF